MGGNGLMARKQKGLPEVEEGTSDGIPLRARGKGQPPLDLACQPGIKRRLSPARASWLYSSRTSKLDEKQNQQIELIRVGHPDLDRAYQLTQMFVCMLGSTSRHRSG